MFGGDGRETSCHERPVSVVMCILSLVKRYALSLAYEWNHTAKIISLAAG